MFVLKGKLLGKGSLQARKCLLTQKQRGLEGFAVVDWESSSALSRYKVKYCIGDKFYIVTRPSLDGVLASPSSLALP